jgi:hypothetical protein
VAAPSTKFLLIETIDVLNLIRSFHDHQIPRTRSRLPAKSPAGNARHSQPHRFTDTIVRYVAERLEELGIPFEMTRRGTIRATLKGQKNSPDRAVSAHLDTIGASVRAVRTTAA